jgi:curved DNA-binding protein CbpA
MSRFDSSKDYYSILGASSDAPPDEIERQYKRRAVQHHPDRGGDEEEMKTLNEAYGVLRDDASRRAYDDERRAPEPPHAYRRRSDEPAPYRASPAAQADAIYGRGVGALLCVGVGVALLLLVRFQWIWFLWPLAILAALVILMGVMMAHAAMLALRESLAEKHPARRYTKVQEALFWSIICGGGYGIYWILTAV